MSSIAFTNPVQVQSGRTTPELIRIYMWLTWSACVIFALTMLSAVHEYRQAVVTVAESTAPSIVAAAQLKAALTDMDANLINEILLPQESNKQALAGYEFARRRAAAALVDAAKNITLQDERLALDRIAIAFGDYQALAQKVRDYHLAGDKRVVQAYRDAAQLLDGELLTQTDTLLKVNKDELEKVYGNQRNSDSLTLMLLFTVGGLVLIALITLQRFLSLRMRRTLNLPLLGATALTLVYLLVAGSAFERQSDHLRGLKDDSFRSIEALWQTRAMAYAANADESRYLFDTERTQALMADFKRKAGTILSSPAVRPWSDLISSMQRKERTNGFSGYLVEAGNNITFPGESEALVKAVRAYVQYVTIDDQIRQLIREGKIQDAVTLCTGLKPEQSNGAFTQFDEALGQALEINQKWFGQQKQDAKGELASFDFTAPAVALCIAGLTFLGVRPRLREYLV